jgi:thymidine kinase
MAIHIITGPMYAGKTSFLINILKSRSLDETFCIKHTKDVRFKESKIVSHDGVCWPAHNLSCLNIPEETFKKVKTIVIDEGHFFDDIYKAEEFAACGKEVIITCLRNGIFMEPIKKIKNLIASADIITALNAVCESCSGIAAFTYRKTAFPNLEPNDPAFFVGGSKEYAVYCRRCFLKIIQFDREHNRGMFSTNTITKLQIDEKIFNMDLNIQGKR